MIRIFYAKIKKKKDKESQLIEKHAITLDAQIELSEKQRIIDNVSNLRRLLIGTYEDVRVYQNDLDSLKHNRQYPIRFS